MSYMKIKVSNVFAKYLNKQLPEYRFTVVKLDNNTYRMQVGTDALYENEAYDYDYATGLTKVIKIEYPEDCYAYPRYIGTKELHNIFRGITTEEEFKNEIKGAFEI